MRNLTTYRSAMAMLSEKVVGVDAIVGPAGAVFRSEQCRNPV